MVLPRSSPALLHMAEPKHSDHPSADDFSCARLTERWVATGDDPREFKLLYDQVCAEFLPQTIAEWICFEQIMRAHWNFKRIDRMEIELLSVVGRVIWENQIMLAMQENLSPEFRKVLSGMRQIEKMRELNRKALASAQRELKRYRKDLKRLRKSATAETRARAARRLADLEPGSNLIQ